MGPVYLLYQMGDVYVRITCITSAQKSPSNKEAITAIQGQCYWDSVYNRCKMPDIPLFPMVSLRKD